MKNLVAMAMMAIATLLTSCSEEEYKQIYLYDTENKTRITDGGELNLYCYREHKYIVRGGSGNYNIEALEGGNISAVWGEKDTLKLTADFPIWASIRIVDDMDYSIGLNINADYLTERYAIDSIYSEVKGDMLRLVDVKHIQKKMDAAIASYKGCTFIFIYDDDKDQLSGQLRITNSQSNLVKNLKFKAEEEVNTSNTPSITYQKIVVFDNNVMIHEYLLMKEFTADHKVARVKMTENMKEKFVDEPYYQNIESVSIHYNLTEVVK